MKKEQRRLATAASLAAPLSMAVLVLCLTAPAHAGELGHYGPALADIRDYLMPAKPGFYFKEYDYFYTTHTFKDRNGDKVSSFPLPGGGTATLNQIFGFGPEVGLIYVPWNAALTFKWQHEFLAENRFEGDNFTLNFAAGFD
jgi:hypothetical protein